MKLLKSTGLSIALALMLFSCGRSSDTVETTEAQEVIESEGQSLSIDLSASKVNWMGYKPTGRHFGTIPITSGEIKVDDNTITGGKFVFQITELKIEDMEEGTEDHGKLFNHLQSDDFFDTANHPEATFEVTSVSPYSSGDAIEDSEEFESDFTPKTAKEQAVSNPTHWISGNLTMRGNTKNIKFPANVSISNGTVTAQAGFNINRTDWGLSFRDESSVADKVADQFIYNTVNVGFEIAAN